MNYDFKVMWWKTKNIITHTFFYKQSRFCIKVSNIYSLIIKITDLFNLTTLIYLSSVLQAVLTKLRDQPLQIFYRINHERWVRHQQITIGKPWPAFKCSPLFKVPLLVVVLFHFVYLLFNTEIKFLLLKKILITTILSQWEGAALPR